MRNKLNQGGERLFKMKIIKTSGKQSKKTPEYGMTSHVHGLAELIL
jgi:hypothetical protein